MLPLLFAAQTPEDLSVYRVDVWVDGALIAAGAAATLVPYAFDKSLIDPRCPCDQSELNRLDRHVVGNESAFAYAITTVATGLAMAAPFAVDIAEVYRSPAFLEDAIVYAQTLALSSAAVAWTKHLFPRPLPLVYADASTALAQRPEGYRAFYSGHMSGAVSMMTALAMTQHYRNGPSAGYWIADAVVALTVAGGVIASGRHFYTDVLAGGAIGFGIGVLVPWIHHRSRVSVGFSSTENGGMLVLATSL